MKSVGGSYIILIIKYVMKSVFLAVRAVVVEFSHIFKAVANF